MGCGKMPEKTLVEVVAAWGGPALASLFAALIGRLAYHSTEVKAGRRAFFGREVLWELPIAVFAAIIGDALASYMGWQSPVSTGVVATLAYLGPRGSEALITRLIRWKSAV